jgi:hypothetical protein
MRLTAIFIFDLQLFYGQVSLGENITNLYMAFNKVGCDYKKHRYTC